MFHQKIDKRLEVEITPVAEDKKINQVEPIIPNDINAVMAMAQTPEEKNFIKSLKNMNDEDLVSYLKELEKSGKDKVKINAVRGEIGLRAAIAVAGLAASVVGGKGSSGSYIDKYSISYIDGVIKDYETHEMLDGRFVLDNGGYYRLRS